MIRLGLELEQRLATRPGAAAALRARARRAGRPLSRRLARPHDRDQAGRRPAARLRRLRAGGGDADLLLVGDGPLRSDLEALAGELGIRDRCHFTGFRTDVGAIYAASDVVALTSANEGTPVTVIEAQAAGKPVVSTDVGGVRDIVTDGVSGFVVRPATSTPSPTGCAARRRSGAAGPARRRPDVAARERYSVPRLVHDVDDLYRELLERAAEARRPRAAADASAAPALPAGDDRRPRASRRLPHRPRLAVLPARDRRDADADAGVRRVPRGARTPRHRRRRVPEPSAGRHPAGVPRPHRRGRPVECRTASSASGCARAPRRRR